MRRVLIALTLIAFSAFMAAPAAADDTGAEPATSSSEPPPAEETTPPPAEETPGTGGSSSGDGGSTSGDGGSTSGDGGSTSGDGGSNAAAGGLPPGPGELPPGTGSTTETGVPPVSISALDAAAADIVILADSTDVRFCHRTNSDDNPYNDPSSATAGVANGHDKEHNGPIWNPTLKDQKIEWGDVIEPYTYNGVDYPGQNWDEAFYDGGCNPSSETILVSAEPPSATDPTCEADGALVLPVTEGVNYSSSPAGTGPGTYTVTATADPGYELIGQTEFEITVQPQRTGDQCIEHPGDSTDVKICHRTNANDNPYNQIPPATAGVANGHDEEHEGPIWDPTLKDLGIEWGDIIEPYTFNGVEYPGQNWAEGEAIYNAGCVFPDIPDEECPEDSEDEECDEDEDECEEDCDDDDDGDDKAAALLPDTGGTSLWTLLMGGMLTVLGMTILANRESMGRTGLFGPVPIDAPSAAWSYTIGRVVDTDTYAPNTYAPSHRKQWTALGALTLVAAVVLGRRASR